MNIQREAVSAGIEVVANQRQQTAALEENIAGQRRFNVEQRQVVADLRTQVRVAQETGSATAGISRALTAASGGFTTFGRRGASAMIGVGLAAEQLANGSESGLRRATRAVETFALAFGPEGLIVAGVLTAGLAIADFFHKAAKDGAKAAAAFKTQFADLANTANTLGGTQQLAHLYQGDAVNGRGEGGGFKNGLTDLEARLTRLRADLAKTSPFDIIDFGRISRQIKDTEALLAEPLRQAKTLENFIRNPLPIPRAVEGLPAVRVEAEGPDGRRRDATRAAAQALHDQAAAIRLVIENLQTARTSGAGVAQAIQAGFLTAQRLSDAIKGAAGHTQRLRDLQGEYNSVVAALKFPTITLPTIKAPDLFPAFDTKKITAGAVTDLANSGILAPVRAAADQVAAIQARFDLTNRIRTAGGQKPLDADAALKPYLDKALEYASIANKAIFGSNLSDSEKRGAYADLLKLLDQAGIKAKALKQPFDGVTASIRTAVGALHSLADLATAAGNGALGNILNTTANLGQNIGSAFDAKTTTQKVTADLGIASSILALGQTLLSDPTKAERNAVTRANTLALQQVSLKLQGFQVNASNTTGAAGALSALFGNSSALAAVARNQTHSGGFLGKQQEGDLQSQLNALDPILKSAGLSFAQLEAITKTYGLELRDKSGRIVVDALSQLRTGLLDAAKAAFTFGKGLNDTQTLAELRDKLSNKTTPLDDLKRALGTFDALAHNLAPQTQGLDLYSPATQLALKKSLLDVVNRVAAGAVNPADFGGLQNLSEFTSVVQGVVSAMDGLQNSVNGVTQSLVNVAPYFKVDAARYNATLPNTLTSGSGFNGGLTPLSPSVVPNVTATVTQTFGDININGTDKDPKQIAVEVRGQLQRMALSRFGTTTRWAETQ